MKLPIEFVFSGEREMKVVVIVYYFQTKLWMFPEGTRNPDFTTLLQFKKGAFHMAISCQVPIYPVIYSPYYFINTKKKRFDKGNGTL